MIYVAHAWSGKDVVAVIGIDPDAACLAAVELAKSHGCATVAAQKTTNYRDGYTPYFVAIPGPKDGTNGH